MKESAKMTGDMFEAFEIAYQLLGWDLRTLDYKKGYQEPVCGCHKKIRRNAKRLMEIYLTISKRPIIIAGYILKEKLK